MIKNKKGFLFNPTDLLEFNESRYNSYITKQIKSKMLRKPVKKSSDIMEMVQNSGMEFEIVRVKNFIEETYTFINLLEEVKDLSDINSLDEKYFINELTKKRFKKSNKGHVSQKSSPITVLDKFLTTVNMLKVDPSEYIHIQKDLFTTIEELKEEKYKEYKNRDLKNYNNGIDLKIINFINDNQEEVLKQFTIERLKNRLINIIDDDGEKNIRSVYNKDFYDINNLSKDFTPYLKKQMKDIDFRDGDKLTDIYQELFIKTKKEMEKGTPIIIQGCLMNKEKTMMGLTDILVKIPYDNDRGYIYEVKDVKRSNTPKSKFVLQICAYSDLLEDIQGVKPRFGDILLGNNSNEKFEVEDFYSYYSDLKQKFNEFQKEKNVKASAKDKSLKYKELALNELNKEDSIESITNISNDEIVLLREHKIYTKKELIEKDLSFFTPATADRLKKQASLTNTYEVLTQFEDESGNLNNLDRLKETDIYIDVKYTETLDRDGFICFYNILHKKDGKLINKTFEAGTKRDEESAFIRFMMYMSNIIKKDEDDVTEFGNIYYFTPKIYSLLIQTASQYNKYIGLINRLYKRDKILSLREFLINSVAINIPDYSYELISEALGFNIPNLDIGFETTLVSLKHNIKSSYDFDNKDEVTDKLQSLSEAKMMFLYKLHNWLITLQEEENIKYIPFEERPDNIEFIKELEEKKLERQIAKEEQLIKDQQEEKFLQDNLKKIEEIIDPSNEKDIKKLDKAKEKLVKFKEKVKKKKEKQLEEEDIDRFVNDNIQKYRFDTKKHADLSLNEKLMTLVFQLVRFFDLEKEMKILDTQELKLGMKSQRIKSLRCLNDIVLIKKEEVSTARSEKINLTYSMKKEDTKIQEGDTVNFFLPTLVNGKVIKMDDNEITIQISKLKSEFITSKTSVSIYENNPDLSKHLTNRLKGYIVNVDIEKTYLGLPKPFYEILSKSLPDLKNHKGDLYDNEIGTEFLEIIKRRVSDLNESYLIIQGPPGTGKSYTSSQIIKQLVQDNPDIKIAISSNSHKAIDGLLISVAKELKGKIPLYKKLSSGNLSEEMLELGIENSGKAKTKREKKLQSSYITAGTVYAMMGEDPVDYLFIDEAGQVSLANLFIMSLIAKNIIIIGDQQQLEQPIQAEHAGDSGKSILEYCLDHTPIVPKDKGFFLPISRRMRKDLCKVVSKYFYQNQLYSIEEAGEVNPKLLGPDENLINVELNVQGEICTKNKGVQFIPVNHQNNPQYSLEEVEKVSEIVDNLLTKTLTIKGETRKIIKDDIIIVSPYNLHVSKLKAKLGEDFKVGSVDLFQGQEAPIVIYSLGASEVSSRGIAFILNTNRFNVALSRGKALALVVGSEELLSVSTESIEELRLLNMFTEITKMK
jgi:predicted RecB family nuclease